MEQRRTTCDRENRPLNDRMGEVDKSREGSRSIDFNE